MCLLKPSISMTGKRVHRRYLLDDETKHRIEVIGMVLDREYWKVIGDAMEIYGALIEERQRIKKKALEETARPPGLIRIPID